MMQTSRASGSLAFLLAAFGCAGHAGITPTEETPKRGADAHAAAASSVARQQLIDEVSAALRREDHAAATAIVERAKRTDGRARPSAQLIAYFDATVHSYQGDYGGAAKILYDHAAKVGPTMEASFNFHDAMIALRTAEGDLIGALVECEEMSRVGGLGTWKPADGERITAVQLKEHWHRAYLLRMIAQTRAGHEREAFIDYAEQARKDYVAVAAPLQLGDSIAVLDAYFAFCDGDRAKMAAAARRVNVAQDDDIEDLYLVQLALEGAGERHAATAVRTRIRELASVTVLTPVFLSWLRSDEAAAANGDPAFSPMYPTGARPKP